MVLIFPLLLLPEAAVKNVLENWIIPDLVYFSIISNRTKCLVKSLNKKDKVISIDPEFGCKVEFFLSWSIAFDVTSEGECTLRMKKHPTTIYRDKKGFGTREWLKHFTLVFNHPTVNVRIGPRNLWKFSLESVRRTLEGFSIENFAVNSNHCEIIKLFPVTRSLSIVSTHLPLQFVQIPSLKFLEKVLIGNHAFVELGRAVSLDLNSLLLMNTPNITSHCPSLSDKELNTFLKLWVNGSNPNLQKINLDYKLLKRIELFEGFNEEVILKGVKHKKRQMLQGRIDRNVFVYDIKRRDGIVATAIIDSIFSVFDLTVNRD